MDKSYVKRYLFSLLALLFAGFIILLALLFALGRSAISTSVELNGGNIILLSAAGALVPTGAYVGAVFFLRRLIDRDGLSKEWIIALCALLPVTFAVITVLGILLILPSIIKSTAELIKSKESDGGE